MAAPAKKEAPAKKSPGTKIKEASAAPAKKAPAPKAEKPAKEVKPKVERLKQNGLTRPLAGSKTGIVWDIADRLSSKDKPADRAAVLKEAMEKHGTRPATAASQYQSWRAFHGITGRAEAAAPAAPAKAPKAEKPAAATA